MKIYYKIWGKNKVALLINEDVYTTVFCENAKEKSKEEIKQNLILNNEMTVNDELIEIK